MGDRPSDRREEKEAIARLIDAWVRRLDTRRQNLARLAGFPDYNLFYQAYLDMRRGVNTDPERAIAVVRAVVAGWPAERRATAREAISFIARTRVPIDRLREVYELFPADEWREAIVGLIGMPNAQLGPPPEDDELRARLIRIERAIGREGGPGDPPPPSAAAGLEAAAATLPPATPIPLPHRMTLSRNALFCGREAELRALAQTLAGSTLAAGQAVAISGLPGVGKTNLASEFAHRFGQYFPGGVFWLNCSDPAAMPVEVAACGRGLIARDDWDQLAIETQAELVRQAWQAADERLLIFDNCEDDELLAGWRPTSGGGRLLLTCRRSLWPPTAGVILLPLDVLPRAESVAMLQRYRPDAAPDDLAALAAELGDLPLALHLAGSYLEIYRHEPPFGEVAHMLAGLRSHDLLGHPALQGIDTSPSGTGHELHVARSFALSLSRLDPDEPRDRATRDLLCRAGYLAPNEAFSRELLAMTLGDISGDPARAARATRQLVGLGMLGDNNALLRIHPLVAAFARSSGPADAGLADVERALIGQCEIYQETDDTPGLRLLLPHLHLRADEAATRNDDSAVRLHMALPHALEAAGSIGGGIPYLERAEAGLRAAGRIETRLGGELLNNLGWWHHHSGDPARARDYHRLALALRQQILAADDADVGESHHNLGDALRELGAFDEAAAHLKQALAIWGRALGPQHERTIAAHNALAIMLLGQERYAEAAAAFQHLLDTASASMRGDRRPIAYLHNNLARALFAQGDPAAARAHYQAALAIHQERLGLEHPDTLLTRYNLARLDLLEAPTPARIAALRELLPICERVLGPEHPLTRRLGEVLGEL